jgi:hypothetical protein
MSTFLRLTAVVLLWVLNGCVYLPASEQQLRGTEFRGKLGPSTSDKPLRVHHATRAEVEAALGPPHDRSVDGVMAGYVSESVIGRWFYLVPPMSDQRHRSYALLLYFDERDVLRRYRIRRWDEPWSFLELGRPSLWELWPEVDWQRVSDAKQT